MSGAARGRRIGAGARVQEIPKESLDASASASTALPSLSERAKSRASRGAGICGGSNAYKAPVKGGAHVGGSGPRRAARRAEAEAASAREAAAVAIERACAALAAEEERARNLDLATRCISAARTDALARIREVMARAARVSGLRTSLTSTSLISARSLVARRALKSDVKKCMALVKRAAAANEETAAALVRDVEVYNLSRYASEIAVALVANERLKTSDIDALLSIAMPLHLRYPDFGPTLVHGLFAALTAAAMAADGGSGALAGIVAASGAARARVPAPPPPDDGIIETATSILPGGDDSADGSGCAPDPRHAAGRVRLLLRLLLELFVSSIYSDTPGMLLLLLSVFGVDLTEAAAAVQSVSAVRRHSSATKAAAATPEASLFFSSNVSASGGPFSSPRTCETPAIPVTERAAVRAARDLPFALAMLRPLSLGVGVPATGMPPPAPTLSQDVLGIVSRRTRMWLGSLLAAAEVSRSIDDVALPMLRAFADAHLAVDSLGLGSDSRSGSGDGDGDIDAVHTAAPAAVLTRFAVRVLCPSPARQVFPTLPHAEQGASRESLQATAAAATSNDIAALASRCLRPHSPVFAAAEQQLLRNAADRFFDCASQALTIEHVRLARAEKRNDVVSFTRGSLPERLAAEVEALRVSLERLTAGVVALADVLDRDVPPLPDALSILAEEEEVAAASIGGNGSAGGAGAGAVAFLPFDDARAYAFYRDLPLLREAVPGSLLDADGALASAGASTRTFDEGEASAVASVITTVRYVPRQTEISSARGSVASALTQLTPEMLGAGAAAAAIAALPAHSLAPPRANSFASGVGAATGSNRSLSRLLNYNAVALATVIGDEEGVAASSGDALSTASAALADSGKADATTNSGGVYRPTDARLRALFGDYAVSAAGAAESDEAAVQALLDTLGGSDGCGSGVGGSGVSGGSSSGGLGGASAAAQLPAPRAALRDAGSSASLVRFQALLERLPECGSKDAVDAWTLEFCENGHCTKPNRGRLIHALFYASAYVPDVVSMERASVLRRGGISLMAQPPPPPPSLCGGVSTDMFPFYARAVATLHAAILGFADPLVALLADELRIILSHFHGRLTAEANGGRVSRVPGDVPEARILKATRNARFLGELVKFGVAPPQLLFGVFQRCLLAWSGESVEVLIAALDAAGSYVLRATESRQHMVRFMELLTRHRARAGDAGGRISRFSLETLDSALSAAQLEPVAVAAEAAADAAAALVSRQPPMHAFVRLLLLDRLTEDNVEDIVRTVRKLPWTASAASSATASAGTEQTTSVAVAVAASLKESAAAWSAPPSRPTPPAPLVEDVVVATVVDASRLATSHGAALAAFLAGLRLYQERAVVRVLDTLCDTIFAALQGDEVMPLAVAAAPGAAPPSPALRAVYECAQHCLGAARMLGECYNYRLCDASLVFRMLHISLNSGHALPHEHLAATASALAAISGSGARLQVPLPADEPGAGGWGFHPFVPCASDPPGSLFRLRLALALLSAAGPALARGHSAPRLARFLVYLQRYALCKGALAAAAAGAGKSDGRIGADGSVVGLDAEYFVRETWQALRPSLPQLLTLADAEAAAGALEWEELLASVDAAAAAQLHANAKGAASAADAAAAVTSAKAPVDNDDEHDDDDDHDDGVEDDYDDEKDDDEAASLDESDGDDTEAANEEGKVVVEDGESDDIVDVGDDDEGEPGAANQNVRHDDSTSFIDNDTDEEASAVAASDSVKDKEDDRECDNDIGDEFDREMTRTVREAVNARRQERNVGTYGSTRASMGPRHSANVPGGSEHMNLSASTMARALIVAATDAAARAASAAAATLTVAAASAASSTRRAGVLPSFPEQDDLVVAASAAPRAALAVLAPGAVIAPVVDAAGSVHLSLLLRRSGGASGGGLGVMPSLSIARLAIPADSRLADRALRGEAARREEADILKRRTLELAGDFYDNDGGVARGEYWNDLSAGGGEGATGRRR